MFRRRSGACLGRLDFGVEVARHRAVPATIRVAGYVTRHTSIACGQRGWKWQPVGGEIGFGMSPVSAGWMLLRRATGDGAAFIRACV